MLKMEYKFVEKISELDKQLDCKLMLGDKVIGESEVYLIAGGMYLDEYLYQTDDYCMWVPYDAMYSIEFDGMNGISKNIGYIHNIVIYEEYRGNSYASYFLKEIEKVVKENGMETMILQPSPLEKSNTKSYFNNNEHLMAFYERHEYAMYETSLIMRTPYYFKSLAS